MFDSCGTSECVVTDPYRYFAVFISNQQNLGYLWGAFRDDRFVAYFHARLRDGKIPTVR